jgi:ABC-type glycerol-3-phosphate transport system permease component
MATHGTVSGGRQGIRARAHHSVVPKLAVIAALAAGYYLASLRWRSVAELVMFVGPGAVLGLTVGWLAYAFRRRRFTWRTGLISAAAGATVLPPVIATVIALTVFVSAEGVIQVFVFGAWAALALGMAAALFTLLGQWVTRRRRAPSAARADGDR